MLQSNVRNNDNPHTLYADEPASTRKAWRNDVAEELELAGMSALATRWLSCSEKFCTKITPGPDAHLPASAEKVSVCSGDHHHDMQVYSQSCDLRICPECARRHSARLSARFCAKAEELIHKHHSTYRFRHITFSLPYPLTDKDISDKYQQGFSWVDSVMDGMMAQAGPWKETQGYFVAAEFGEKGRKLHYHVVHYGQYLDQAELSRRWDKANGGAAQVVDVRQVHRKNKTLSESIQEILKYVTKFWSKDKVTLEIKYIAPELMPVLAKVLEGTRRVRAHGVFYNLPEPDRADNLCETCQSPMVSIPIGYFEIYCNTGMLPREFYDAGGQAVLHLKLADKSGSGTGALSPPETEKQAIHQMQMKMLKELRSHIYDW